MATKEEKIMANHDVWRIRERRLHGVVSWVVVVIHHVVWFLGYVVAIHHIVVVSTVSLYLLMPPSRSD